MEARSGLVATLPDAEILGGDLTTTRMYDPATLSRYGSIPGGWRAAGKSAPITSIVEASVGKAIVSGLDRLHA
jgi:hypothetical protein